MRGTASGQGDFSHSETRLLACDVNMPVMASGRDISAASPGRSPKQYLLVGRRDGRRQGVGGGERQRGKDDEGDEEKQSARGRGRRGREESGPEKTTEDLQRRVGS